MKNTAHIKKIAVIGQGYVGLPLAIELAVHFCVVGFDIDDERLNELSQGIDHTNEADIERLKTVLIRGKADGGRGALFTGRREIGLRFSSAETEIKDAEVFIVTVPTPIDHKNAPNLDPLKNASRLLGSVLKPGDIVVYESTVYPGCTEEICVPILAQTSGLIYNQDFFVGYSPERINPGDKTNTLTTIQKVTSGSTPEVADEIAQLYNTIITAGTYKAPSIKVAEASKAIENAQRDLNISFMNELALVFDRMGIDTNDVLEAAGTKFNFLRYRPGLVGGHCISVDPYYLTHKAIQLGYYPDVILSGRRVNNSIPSFIAGKVVKMMTAKNIELCGAKALILGITFKENCPDIRNTRVVDIYHELREFGLFVDVYDPWADPGQVYREYQIRLLPALSISNNEGSLNNSELKATLYDTVILATAHDDFLTLDVGKIKKEKSIVFDTKGVLPRSSVDARL